MEGHIRQDDRQGGMKELRTDGRETMTVAVWLDWGREAGWVFRGKGRFGEGTVGRG